MSSGCLQAGGLRTKGWNWILRRAEQGTGRTAPREDFGGNEVHAQAQPGSIRGAGAPGTGIQARAVATKKQTQSQTGLSSAPTPAQARAHAGCMRVRGAAWDRACSLPTEQVRGTIFPGSGQVLGFPAASPGKGPP